MYKTITSFFVGLFPLCFGVVDSESNDNWLWFMEKLQTVIEDERVIVFMSDRNVGIKEAISKVFPCSSHGYCLYHLKNNLRSRLAEMNTNVKENIINLFTRCAYAPTKKSFQGIHGQLICQGGWRVKKFLEELPYDRWTNAYFPRKRYGKMISNLMESFNSWIEKERHLPITKLIDRIRVKLMEQMSTQKKNATN